MAKLEFLTVCDYAMTSQQGKLSIIGMFSRIFVSAVPAKYPRLFVVAIVAGQPQAKLAVTFRLTSPTGQLVLPERQVELELGAHGRSNIITDVSNLTFGEAGTYKLAFNSGGKSLGETELYVSLVKNVDQAELKE